ncbi:MAG: ABC transporter permease subunit [Verrucomicrobia bacterium]|nr:ABC transporter permease subunit [Verrucomicrobiota bacterium]
MNALVRKEIKLLLPSFSIAVLLALSLWLAPSNSALVSPLSVFEAVFPFLLCPAVVVIMALDSFGREMSSGTFANLLAQPVSRSRLWWTKTMALAGALVLVLGVWWLSFLGWRSHAALNAAKPDLGDLAMTTGLILLTAFSGGLWTVLLFRTVAAAFWFTLLVPAGLTVATRYFTEKFFAGANPTYAITAVLTVYSIAGFLWARRMFLRAQDVQWTGGDIAMPAWLKLPRMFVAAKATQSRGPRLALLKKEIQLHQSQFVIAGILAFLHLGMVAARKAAGGFKDSPMMEFLTGQFWVLWVVMPLLIGCAAVAEERKLGTFESQLCLSSRRRTQFAIKFLVVLMLSCGFGVIVPLLFEGGRIVPDIQSKFSNFALASNGQVLHGNLLWAVLSFIDSLLPLLPQLAIVIGVTTISFFASTLARNTLQALAPTALGIVVASVLVINGSDPEAIVDALLWRGWLAYLIGIPTLTVALAWLMYGNFKQVLVGWKVWRRNGIVLLASLVAVVTLASATYHRVWELVSPIEPPHGVARLTPSPGVTLRCEGVWNGGRDFLVRLSDGRIWTDRFEFKDPSLGALLLGEGRSFTLLPGGRFFDGTNWSSFAICNGWEAVGVKSDGSLWVSKQPTNPVMLEQSALHTASPAGLVRFGADNNWKSAAREADTSATLLKEDGTLWRLGTNRLSWKKPWPGLRTFKPQRLGADSDWAEIFSNGDQTYFRKTNGESWRFASRAGSVKNAIQLDEEIWLYRVADFELFSSRGDVSAYSRRGANFMVGVREDGTFRVTGAWQPSPNKATWTMAEQNFQLGKETDWIALAGDGESVVTLKNDGSLWKWTFSDDPITYPDAASCARLGTHSDWIAVNATMMGELVSLAADGSLWSWQFESMGRRSPSFTSPVGELRPLLGVSRKPQTLANIFDDAK